MRYITRSIEQPLRRAAPHFPALILTGPRRSGKTTLLRTCFPAASYHLLEDPDVIGRVRADPRSFLDSIRLPAILDEIQNVPDLFRYVRTRVDESAKRSLRWIMTGSQEPALMKGVSESMAGRAAIFNLLPLSRAESARVTLLRGGFPEVIGHPSVSDVWFRSYVQTYLERDIRSLSSIRDLSTFRRFLALLASRVGNILNRSEIAAPLGVSVPTVSEWLSLLEMTHQILLVPPYFENFGKRIVKSPKIYFTDTGLVAHLLGLVDETSLERSTFYGPLFESYVASEIIKAQLNAGRAREIYFFRDRQGLEVDFLVPGTGRRLLFLEAKATRTVRSDTADSMSRLRNAIPGRDIDSYIVHLPFSTLKPFTVVRAGVRAVTAGDLPGIVLGQADHGRAPNPGSEGVSDRRRMRKDVR